MEELRNITNFWYLEATKLTLSLVKKTKEDDKIVEECSVALSKWKD